MKFLWFEKVKVFFKEVKAEMKKVSWPSRKDVAGTTLVTIVATLILAIYLYLADIIFTFLVKYIYSLGV
ncbi:MAG: preprotein translocase subunit SecE [Thermoanaerobaculia bacterium]